MLIFAFAFYIYPESPMATKLDPKELVTFKELLMANSIQLDAAVQLLIEKGFFTEQEFYAKLRDVQAQYQAKRHA
jgi:hypothetical protein